MWRRSLRQEQDKRRHRLRNYRATAKFEAEIRSGGSGRSEDPANLAQPHQRGVLKCLRRKIQLVGMRDADFTSLEREDRAGFTLGHDVRLHYPDRRCVETVGALASRPFFPSPIQEIQYYSHVPPRLR
jgi:hypothetical protein